MRQTIKRYSIGRTLEKMGALMQLSQRENNVELECIPALRKMFFNCMRFVTEKGSYMFVGKDLNFKHSDFVSLYKFASEHPSEMTIMLDTNANTNDIVSWTRNEVKKCFFTR